MGQPKAAGFLSHIHVSRSGKIAHNGLASGAPPFFNAQQKITVFDATVVGGLQRARPAIAVENPAEILPSQFEI